MTEITVHLRITGSAAGLAAAAALLEEALGEALHLGAPSPHARVPPGHGTHLVRGQLRVQLAPPVYGDGEVVVLPDGRTGIVERVILLPEEADPWGYVVVCGEKSATYRAAHLRPAPSDDGGRTARLSRLSGLSRPATHPDDGIDRRELHKRLQEREAGGGKA